MLYQLGYPGPIAGAGLNIALETRYHNQSAVVWHYLPPGQVAADSVTDQSLLIVALIFKRDV